MNIDLTSLAVAVTGGVFSVLGIILTVWLQSHINNKTAADTVASAVNNSLGAIQQAAKSTIQAAHPMIPGVPKALAPGVQYVLDHAGEELDRLGITPQAVASKIEAKIGLANLAVTNTTVASVLVALFLIASLGACSQLDRATTDINTLLDNSVASTMVAYVVELSPRVKQVAQTMDSAVARVSPETLRVACGGLNAINFIYKTASVFLPRAIPPASADAADRVNNSFQASVCSGPPPTNLADAVRAIIAQYRSTEAALIGVGVKL